jgi:hypothetical protein
MDAAVRARIYTALSAKIIPGFLGSAAMEILRFYKIKVLATAPDVPNAAHYWWVSVLFMLTGGVVAHYWDDENGWRSFVIGLSWPALVAAFVK